MSAQPTEIAGIMPAIRSFAVHSGLVPEHSTASLCHKCHGTGGHGAYYDELGYLVRWKETCDCPAGEKAREEAAANAAASRARRIATYLRDAGIPERFRSLTLKGSPHRQIAARMANAPEDSSWLLYGPVGRGKTALATAYLQRWIRRMCRRGLFVTLPNLLAELRETYDAETSELDVLERYSRTGLLVLDDIGAEAVGNREWLLDRLFHVVGSRHAGCRPTVFTTNLTPKALRARLGERIWDRVMEMCGPERIVHVAGPNLRMQGCAQERTHGCTTSSNAG